jgi:methylenetetrahydrofolate--tRNA-(uracil-5-)-methyltransferase
MKIHVIGAGLAGCEAAYLLARRGYAVDLFEMKPELGPAFHEKDLLAELVCSNSLKSLARDNASGLLKAEMKALGSLVMESAEKNRLPGGQDLSVDRTAFSRYITDKVLSLPNVRLVHEKVTSLEKGEDVINIVCSGPLTAPELVSFFQNEYASSFCSFFDAAAPLVYVDSLDLSKMYFKSRYDKGEGSYLNVPLTKEEYEDFVRELCSAERAELHDFDHFEACLPVEVMAKRGIDTLRFGPLKPKGLETENVRPYAVVQLRQDDVAGDLYNMVGFQTNLKYGEQKRVFSLLPGFSKARFARFGLMHRNTYINAPMALNRNLSLKQDRNTYVAGQFSGVEGYPESAASGLLAGYYVLERLEGKPFDPIPTDTMLGSLINYLVMSSPKHFAPMNATYGIYQYPYRMNKEEVYEHSSEVIPEWLGRNF